MKRKDWKIKRAIEKRFYNAIAGLRERVYKIAHKHKNLGDIIDEIQAITDLPAWQTVANHEAYSMTRSVMVENAKTWREAAQKGTEYLQIHKILRAELDHNAQFNQIIESNAQYISNLPADVARDLAKHLATQTVAGLRAESLLDDIRQYAPHITTVRARCIARTESAKTWEAVTKTRALKLGKQYYFWRTSMDNRVRQSHAHMEGVICDFLSPPCPEMLCKTCDSVGNFQYYNAGFTYNCRCFSEVYLNLESQLNGPLKIVQNNQIVRISKKDFLQLVS